MNALKERPSQKPIPNLTRHISLYLSVLFLLFWVPFPFRRQWSTKDVCHCLKAHQLMLSQQINLKNPHNIATNTIQH